MGDLHFLKTMFSVTLGNLGWERRECRLGLISDNLIFIPENVNFLEGNYNIISIPKFCTDLSPA